MRLNKEYNWLNSYMTSPQFWSEDILSWDESFDLPLTDYTLFTLLTSPFAFKTYVYFESFIKLSFLDIIIMSENSEIEQLQELYNAVMWDLYEIIQVLFYSSQFIYYTNYQDFFLVVLHHSPELTIPLVEFITTYWNGSIFKFLIAARSAIFTDHTLQLITKFNFGILILCLGTWFILLFIHTARLTKWGQALESYLTRLLTYLSSLSKEVRIEFESIVIVFFLALFLLFSNTTIFSDWFGETYENMTLTFFYTFLVLYCFFIIKTSIHNLAFLEASNSNRRGLSFYIQFGKDVTNGVILLVRFFTLLIRLNLYDTVDDVLDSYYIFVCDFQDEINVTDSSLFCNLCLSGLLNNGSSLSKTLLNVYNSIYHWNFGHVLVVVCLNVLFFTIFILELVGRVFLGFFILYLVIFEMQSVNRSHVEDNYLNNVRKDNIKTNKSTLII